MKYDETTGLYYIDGLCTQSEAPSIDNPIEIECNYKVGKHIFEINGIKYEIELVSDLKGTDTLKERLWLNIGTLEGFIERKFNVINNAEYFTGFSNNTFGLKAEDSKYYSNTTSNPRTIMSNRFVNISYKEANSNSKNGLCYRSSESNPCIMCYDETLKDLDYTQRVQWFKDNPTTIMYEIDEPFSETFIAKKITPLEIIFDNETIDDIAYIELTNNYKIFTNKNFALGSTSSNNYSLKLKKEYAFNPKIVEIEEYSNKKAVLFVDKIEDNSKDYFDYSLTDGMVNFEFKYDASLIFEDGKTTVKKILEDICSKAGIRLATTEFIGQDLEVSWHDNTVTARTYIGYIAELNGGFARINNNGELELVQFKNDSKATINLDDCEDYTLGEYHKITRVIFDNGVLVSSFGDDTGNTLYLNTSNVFINDEETVEQIYNSIKDFEFYSFSTKNFPYVEVMAGDIVTFTDGENNYQVIAQYELEYFGSWFGSLETEIQSLKQEETRVISEQEKYNRIIIEQNRTKGEIKILAETSEQIKNDLDETNSNISNNYYNKQQAEQLIINSATGLTNTFSEAGGNNILKNTNFSANEVLEEGQKYEYWFGNVIRNSNNSSVNGYSILLQNGNLNQEEIVANGPYTLSFYYKKLNPLANVYVAVNGKKYELTSEEITLFQTGIKDEEGNYIAEQINVSDNHFKVEFITDIDNSCEIYDIMANYGTIKLAYSQNANETITDTVNISKGITITSSTSEVKFTANNDGIRTKTLNDEVITEFTDKGMKTKEAVIENEATIVGVLRQRVGEQVWDSLI